MKEDSRARSVRLRFSQIEDMEGLDMETDKQGEEDLVEEVNTPNIVKT